MAEDVLLCDLSIKGKVTVALWNRKRGLATTTQLSASNRAEFDTALLTYLDGQGSPFLDAAALAVPGWEYNGIQIMPNHGYDLERDWLRKVLNVNRLHLVNPTVARALAIPGARPQDFETLKDGSAIDDQLKCVIGTGPGLGMAMLVPDSDGGWSAFSGAAGRSDLPWGGDEEVQLLRPLRSRLERASREDVVSLNGLRELWHCLAEIEDASHQTPEVEEIIAQAGKGDVRALKAVDLCLNWLARCASDFALFSGARGGVYLSGELVILLGDLIDKGRFAQQFVNKGRASRLRTH